MKISYTKQTTYRNGSLKNQGYEFGSNYAILIFPLCETCKHPTNRYLAWVGLYDTIITKNVN
jgi:hypothetical protein